MSQKTGKPGGSTGLRRRAEDRISRTDSRAQADGEELKLLHELRVHQVELELQNEELRRARAELEKTLEKYADLYDFAPVGYFTLNAKGLIREVNLAGAELLGESRFALANHASFVRFVAGESRPVFEAFLSGVFQGKAPEICDATLRIGGKRVPVRIEASLGEIRAECRVVVIDLTATRRAEEKARLAEERLRFLLLVSSAMIYSAKPTGTYAPVFIGVNTHRLIGYRPEDFPKRESFWMEHIHPEDRAAVLRSLSSEPSGEPSVREYRFRKRDGDYIWVRDQHELLRDEDGTPREIVGYMLDVTREKRIEEERERTLLELREALAKVRTLSGMLPICANCKKIRDDSGYWQQVESYIQTHSEAVFSHGICPECARKLYPEIDWDKLENVKKK